MAEDRKCAMDPCTCEPPEGEAFCSEYCRHTATSGQPRKETVCRCGHPGCLGEE